jgi:integrase
MPAVKLTKSFVDSVACEDAAANKVSYYDSVVSGLVLEVHKSGRKTFFFRYLDQRGAVRQPKICDARELSVPKIRKLILRYRGQLAIGIDPFAIKREQRSVPTLEEFVLASYMPFVKNYKRSWTTDLSLLNGHILPALGSQYLDMIKRSHLLELVFKHREAHKPASTNRIIILLRYIYNLAIKWEVEGVKENPVQGIPLYEENNKRERFLEGDEIQSLMSALDDSRNKSLKSMVYMLLLTGARRGELLTAKWDQLDFVRKIWTVPLSKSGKVRHIPMSDMLCELLIVLRNESVSEYLFINEVTGKPFTNFFRAWDSARQKANMPDLRVHDLRHSFASFLVNGGRSIYEVQTILGHSQIKTTQRYAHLSNGSLVSAANEAAKRIGTF